MLASRVRMTKRVAEEAPPVGDLLFDMEIIGMDIGGTIYYSGAPDMELLKEYPVIFYEVVGSSMGTIIIYQPRLDPIDPYWSMGFKDDLGAYGALIENPFQSSNIVMSGPGNNFSLIAAYISPIVGDQVLTFREGNIGGQTIARIVLKGG